MWASSCLFSLFAKQPCGHARTKSPLLSLCLLLFFLLFPFVFCFFSTPAMLQQRANYTFLRMHLITGQLAVLFTYSLSFTCIYPIKKPAQEEAVWGFRLQVMVQARHAAGLGHGIWTSSSWIPGCKLAVPWFGVGYVQMQLCFHDLFIVDCFQVMQCTVYIMDWWMVTWAVVCRWLTVCVLGWNWVALAALNWLPALQQPKATCSVFHLLTLFQVYK